MWHEIKFHECIAKNAGTGPCTKKGNGRFCSRHMNQYYGSKIIDWNGNKIRDPQQHGPVYEECLGKNAGTGACTIRETKNQPFCKRHQSQLNRGIIDKKGNKIRELKRERKQHTQCILHHLGDCKNYYHGKYCSRHKQRIKQGIIDKDGNKLRLLHGSNHNELKCAVPGCSDPGGYRSGYCRYHYMMIIDLGHYEMNPKLFPKMPSTMEIEYAPLIR